MSKSKLSPIEAKKRRYGDFKGINVAIIVVTILVLTLTFCVIFFSPKPTLIE